MQLVICNNTKDSFSWESEKMNVKFHKNCENTGKIRKIPCVRCNFVKFDINSRAPIRNFLCCYHRWLIASLARKNVKKNAIFFKLFWYKVFLYWKLKLLHFPMVDSVLMFQNNLTACWCSKQVLWELNSFLFFFVPILSQMLAPWVKTL